MICYYFKIVYINNRVCNVINIFWTLFVVYTFCNDVRGSVRSIIRCIWHISNRVSDWQKCLNMLMLSPKVLLRMYMFCNVTETTWYWTRFLWAIVEHFNSDMERIIPFISPSHGRVCQIRRWTWWQEKCLLLKLSLE